MFMFNKSYEFVLGSKSGYDVSKSQILTKQILIRNVDVKKSQILTKQILIRNVDVRKVRF